MTENLTDQELIDNVRADCKASLYVFAQVICGFDRFIPTLHRDMCNFLQYNKSLRKMLLAPRDHYKSSVVQAFILWRLVNNPEERILIAGDTAGTAQNKLKKIRQFLETSMELRAFFPEIVPKDTSKVAWAQDMITVNRKGVHAEPSITAEGVGGARAGAHYTLIICDDVATKQAKDEPSTMKKIKDWADGMEAMLERAYENQIVVVGTPWSHEDVYEHLRAAWGDKGRPGFYSELKRPFFGTDGEPIFPDLYGGRDNAIDFATRTSETNPYLWYCNFMLEPQIPDAEFRESDLQYYQLSANGQYLLYRPEGATQPNIVPISNLEVYIAIDPAFTKEAGASKAAINVSAIAPDGNIFILESIGIKQGTDALISRICELVDRYGDQLRKLGVEKVGQQQGFIDYLTKELRRRGSYRRVDPLPPGSAKSKEARIRSTLQPFFGQRRVWLHVSMRGLLDEFRKFPLSEVKDELDAMAYGAAYYWSTAQRGGVANYEAYLREYEESRLDASETTGY